MSFIRSSLSHKGITMQSIVRLSAKGKFFAIIVISLGSFLFASSASADPTPWKYASWGRAYAFVFPLFHFSDWVANGQTDDIKTDGYCVYLRVRFTGHSWPGTSYRNESKSCGSQTVFHLHFGLLRPVGVRLYRDDGRYLTIWGN
jgi:hypothetical protein